MLLRRKTGQVLAWQPTTFRAEGLAERDLEAALAEHPEWLADTGDGARGPAYAVFSQRTLQGVLGRTLRPDLLLLSDDGELTVVEVKLADNPELRDPRQVLSQLVHYATAIASLSGAGFAGVLGGSTLTEVLSAKLPDAPDPARLARAVERRRRDGEINLVIAADGLPPGFDQFVESVAQQATLAFTLRAVEVQAWCMERGGDLLLTQATPVETQIVARSVVTIHTADPTLRVEVSATGGRAVAEAVEGAKAPARRPGARGKRRPWLWRSAEALGLEGGALLDDLIAINDAAAARDWRWVTERVAVQARDAELHHARNGRYGRLGLDLLEGEWRPGLFVGVIYDGRDHAVTPSSPDGGADFVVIVSVDRNALFEGETEFTPAWYLGHPLWRALVDRLLADPGEWAVHDHLNAVPRPNRWHPLHLRRPLAEVFAGALTRAEREARWQQAAESAFRRLLSGGELTALRDAMRAGQG